MKNPLLALASMLGLPSDDRSREERAALADLARAQDHMRSAPLPTATPPQTSHPAEQYRREAMTRAFRPRGPRWARDYDRASPETQHRIVVAAEAKQKRKTARRERDEIRSKVGRMLLGYMYRYAWLRELLPEHFDARTLRRIAFGDGAPRWLQLDSDRPWIVFGEQAHVERELWLAEGLRSV